MKIGLFCGFFFARLVRFSCSVQPYSEGEDDSAAYFAKQESRRGMGSFDKRFSTQVESALDCAFTCRRLLWCKSYNFRKVAGRQGKHLCEALPSANRALNVENNDQFDHFVKVVSRSINSNIPGFFHSMVHSDPFSIIVDWLDPEMSVLFFKSTGHPKAINRPFEQRGRVAFNFFFPS